MEVDRPNRSEDHRSGRCGGHLHPAALPQAGLEPFGSAASAPCWSNGRPSLGLHDAGRRRAWWSRTTPSKLCASSQDDHRDAVRRRQPLLHVLREERQLRAAGDGLPLRHHGAEVPLPVAPTRSRRLASRHPDRPQSLHPLRRCVRTSRDLDGKHVFDFVGRGREKQIGVNAAPGWPIRTSTSPTRHSTPARSARCCANGSATRHPSANGCTTSNRSVRRSKRRRRRKRA